MRLSHVGAAVATDGTIAIIIPTVVLLLLALAAVTVECGSRPIDIINARYESSDNIVQIHEYGGGHHDEYKKANAFNTDSRTIGSEIRSRHARYSNDDAGILLEKNDDNGNNDNNAKSDNDTSSIVSVVVVVNERNVTVLLGDRPAGERSPPSKRHYSLALSIIPLLTIFGNGLVVAAVWRERALQTVTNLLIVSLAISDFMVAFCVMSFGVYFEWNAFVWGLGPMLCNLYIGADVTCSTASILNLLAISLDRFMAIKYPLTYTQYGANNRRALFSICIVWVISLSVGLPVVFGANHIDQHNEEFCGFTNPFFIIISSVCSFFVPCALMIVLYAIIFRQLRARERARRMRQLRRSQRDASSIGGTTTCATADGKPLRSGTDRISSALISGARWHCQIGTYFKMRGDQMLMDLSLQTSSFPTLTPSASTESVMYRWYDGGGNGIETTHSSMSIVAESDGNEMDGLKSLDDGVPSPLHRCNTLPASRAAPSASSTLGLRRQGSARTMRKSMAIRLLKRNLSRTSIINDTGSGTIIVTNHGALAVPPPPKFEMAVEENESKLIQIPFGICLEETLPFIDSASQTSNDSRMAAMIQVTEDSPKVEDVVQSAHKPAATSPLRRLRLSVSRIAPISPRGRANRRYNTIATTAKRMANGTLPYRQSSCVETTVTPFTETASNAWTAQNSLNQSDGMATTTTMINYASLASTPLDGYAVAAAARVLSPDDASHDDSRAGSGSAALLIERSVSSYSNVCESASSADIMPPVCPAKTTSSRSLAGRCMDWLRGRRRRASCRFFLYSDNYRNSRFFLIDRNNNHHNGNNNKNRKPKSEKNNENGYGMFECGISQATTVVLSSRRKSKVQKPSPANRLGLAFARLWRRVYAAGSGGGCASTRYPVAARPSRQLVKKATKQMKREQKATVTLAIVLVVFLVCWVPFFALHLTNGICLLANGGECVHFLATFLSTWLGYLNSSLNPLIYTLFDQRFRKAFRNVLHCAIR